MKQVTFIVGVQRLVTMEVSDEEFAELQETDDLTGAVQEMRRQQPDSLFDELTDAFDKGHFYTVAYVELATKWDLEWQLAGERDEEWKRKLADSLPNAKERSRN